MQPTASPNTPRSYDQLLIQLGQRLQQQHYTEAYDHWKRFLPKLQDLSKIELQQWLGYTYTLVQQALQSQKLPQAAALGQLG